MAIGASSAAADQRAQIAAPEAEILAEPRGDARAELRVGRLEPDRGAEAGRDQGEDRQIGAVGERHLAAEQRVGLDRIDDLARAPAADEHADPAGERAADRGQQQDAPPVERIALAEMGAGRDRERDLMDLLDQHLDEDDAEPDGDAERGAGDDERDLVVAQVLAPQPAQQEPPAQLEVDGGELDPGHQSYM
jgi:hypothetical protein